jgi:hypothetical protein
MNRELPSAAPRYNKHMKYVVVGGQSRDVGKTSVVAAIIAALPQRHWTAVKITQFGHGICSRSGEACGCAVTAPDCPYAIDEERDTAGRTDTARFLRAGARRALWVRTPMRQLGTAMPALRAAIDGAEHVIMESNSVVEFLRPDVYLTVLDPAVEDFKVSARRFLDQADAALVMGNTEMLESGPATVFRTERGLWLTPEVVSFLEQRLQ